MPDTPPLDQADGRVADRTAGALHERGTHWGAHPQGSGREGPGLQRNQSSVEFLKEKLETQNFFI